MKKNGEIFKLASGAIPSIFDPFPVNHRAPSPEVTMLANKLVSGSTHGSNDSERDLDDSIFVPVSRCASPPKFTENVSDGEGSAHSTNDFESHDGEKAEKEERCNKCDQCYKKDAFIRRQETIIKRLRNRLNERSLHSLTKRANYLRKKVDRLRATSKQMRQTLLDKKKQMKMDQMDTNILQVRIID